MKFKIKENQYVKLVERKKDQKLIEEILSKIDRANKSLNETTLINEAIGDILLIYKKKGLINEYVQELLINSDKLTKKQINKINL
jgi:hypothetical protein